MQKLLFLEKFLFFFDAPFLWNIRHESLEKLWILDANITTHSAFTCSKLVIRTLEQGVKFEHVIADWEYGFLKQEQIKNKITLGWVPKLEHPASAKN